MNNSKDKHRALAILFVLGGILALVASWDVLEDRPSQARVDTRI
jgi:hypothetical protein